MPDHARSLTRTDRGPRPRLGPERVGPYAIDHSFESLLTQANAAWSGIEAELVPHCPSPRHPLVVICYAPRTGSTMLAQRLARTKAFHYVSNFIARFWEAPYLAGMIERRLGLREATFAPNIDNAYGVTAAPHEPHEFGFFWNRWLTFAPDTHCVDEAAMTPARVTGLRQELAALMSLYDQPFFLKSDLVGLNPAFFARLFDDVRFVVLRREPLFTAQSIYQARLDLYHDAEVYWSTRPSNHPDDPDLYAPDQIALQLKGIYEDIEAGLKATSAPALDVHYEALCADPLAEMRRLFAFAGLDPAAQPQGQGLKPGGGNRCYLPQPILQSLEEALARWL